MNRKTSIWVVIIAFCLQVVEAQTESIAIVTYKAEGVPLEQTWDPDSISSGITGSEEAVIYMAEHLVRLGHTVTVFGYPPKGSPYSGVKANPRYLHVDEFSVENPVDIAIAWRMPVIGKELKKCAKKVYLWPHDKSWPALLTEKQINAFDDVLWLSSWQKEQWVEKNPGFSKFSSICGNGINPGQFIPIKKRKNPYSCIYGSNYGQGLSVLLDLWPMIKQEFPKATLDIYYGWNHFGFLTKEQEEKMKQQVKELKELGVVDHGMVGHKELNKAYSQTSFWTYPCIGTETFSITALKAQCAGAIPVVIKGSALEETVGGGYACKEAKEYKDTLIQALRAAEEMSVEEREQLREFVLKSHTWEAVARRWELVFSK